MATMLGNCTNKVEVVFQQLPSSPDFSSDPLAKYVPHEELYLQRWRELDLAHSLQYSINDESINNLSSRLQAVTERVSKTIIHVLGDTESAQKAVAGLRSCRMLETAESISRRTVKHPGEIHVCKEDPAVHKGLPKFVWLTPEADAAAVRVAPKLSRRTVADFEKLLLFQHVNNMFQPAIAAQQHIIHSLVDALSEQNVIHQLHKVLRTHKVPKKTITRICAKVVALQCHWTTEIPTHWLSEPVKTRSSGQHPSCVIVEEPSCSTRNSNSSKGGGCFLCAWPKQWQQQVLLLPACWSTGTGPEHVNEPFLKIVWHWSGSITPNTQ